MSYYRLNDLDKTQWQNQLLGHDMVIVCLCAAWCRVCDTYMPAFIALAEEFSEKLFLWVDVEDQSDWVENLSVENFPTLLIQRQRIVTFYGPLPPHITYLKRLIQEQSTQPLALLEASIDQNEVKKLWQKNRLV